MESQRREKVVEVAGCHEIGLAVLEPGRPLPRSSPVEVTFALGPDGLLTVTGKESTTGLELSVTFETASIMSGEEVAAARKRNAALQVA